MTVNGGLRVRLIKSAVQRYIEDNLDALGWFDAPVTEGGTRQHRQVTFYRKPAKWDEPVELNAVMVHSDDSRDTELELGSGFTEDTYAFYCDVYAEKDSVGEHIAGDVRDILRGLFPSIGCTRPVIRVYDPDHATPLPVTLLQLESVDIQRARNAPHAWQRHWFAVAFTFTDYYDDIVDGTFVNDEFTTFPLDLIDYGA